MVYWQYFYITGPIRFCSKICHVGGRILSAPTTHRNFRSVIRWHRLRRGGYQPPGCFPMGKQRRRIAPTMAPPTFMICTDLFIMAHAPYFADNQFFESVGADIIRPVVFPMGKQRRRKAPTMHHQTFANEIRRYNVETWHICNIRTPV